MVVTAAPSASTASMAQLFTDLPSTQTVQAPHWLVSQPTWVPVSRRCSRSNSTSNVRGSTSTTCFFSLTWSEIVVMTPPSGWPTAGCLLTGRHGNAGGSGVQGEAGPGQDEARVPDSGTDLKIWGHFCGNGDRNE